LAIPHATGFIITGESRYPLIRIAIVGERIVGESKDAAATHEWIPACAGTTRYHIHEYSNAIALPIEGGGWGGGDARVLESGRYGPTIA
jgi:hypothetical protein